MNAKDEVKAQIGLYRSMAIVGGRGYGKTVMLNAAIEAQRQRAGELMADWAEEALDLEVGDIIEGVTDLGASFGPFDANEPLYRAANYTAQMSFTRLYPYMFDSFRRAEEEAGKRRLAEQAGFATWEDWINASWAYTDPRYHANVLGRWSYTPAEELLHRLNTRLQGKDPGLPVNTRYWRDQK